MSVRKRRFGVINLSNISRRVVTDIGALRDQNGLTRSRIGFDSQKIWLIRRSYGTTAEHFNGSSTDQKSFAFVAFLQGSSRFATDFVTEFSETFPQMGCD